MGMIDQIRHVISLPAFWAVVGITAYFLLLFSVSYFEKRWVTPYVAVRPLEDGVESILENAENHAVPLPYADVTGDPCSLPDYVRVMSDEAFSCGLVFGQVFAHAKPAIKIFTHRCSANNCADTDKSSLTVQLQ